MRVLLLGPPGAGKGTQAVKLAEKLGIPQISTGELFRRNIEEGTKLGVEAKRYLDAGDLVPSDLTNELVDDRLNNPDAANGFILDGYPRSVEQAKALHEMLERRGTDIDAVLEFRVSEEVLLERLKGRGRADDTDDVILNRMKVYRDETAPLLEYYRDQLKTVDAVGTMDEVFARALRAQHRHIARCRSRARLLGLRLRRLRYLRTAAARRPQVTTPGGRAQVLAAIQKALDIKGVHDPAARARWTRGMDLVARRESNYNANAINHWDSNAARGTPSRGVWQFIAPTFAAYHEPGTSTNIHDLVAQACAFINYARGHYGVAADASNLADLIQQADPRRSPRGY